MPPSLLRECAAFHSVADGELEELAACWRRVELPMGENLFLQGDPPGSVYLIDSGRARVIRVDEESGHRSLGLRVRGDLIGERALLTGSPRSATIRAAEDLVVWEMEAGDFERFLEAFPGLRASLTAYFDQIGLRTFLKSISELTPLKPERVRSLVERIERVEAPPGTDVVVEGGPGDSMYFISEGEATVRFRGHLLRTLGPGGFFGERALLTREPRSATVSAVTAMVLYRLGCPAFEEMIEDSPAVKQKLFARMESLLHYIVLQRDYGIESATAETTPRPRATRRFQRGRRLPRWMREHVPFLAYPTVLQRDEMDCGPACLATVLAAYGVKRSLSRVREEIAGTREGATIEDLARAAEQAGFEVRLASRQLSDLDQVPLPSIAYWNGNHFTVLFGRSPRGILLGDPAVGLRVLSPEEFLRGWTGILLELEPTPELDRGDSLRASWAPLWRWLAGMRAALGACVAMMVVEAGLIGILAASFGRILERRILGGGPDLEATIFLVATGLTCALVHAVRSWIFWRAWSGWSKTGMAGYLENLLSMPERSCARMTVSDLMVRSAMSSRLREWIERTFEPMVFAGLLASVLSVHLLVSRPLWGGAILAGILAAELSWSLAGLAARPARLLGAMADAEATGQLTEVLGRIRDYRSASLIRWVKRRWLALSRQAGEDASRAKRFLSIGGFAGSVFLLAAWGLLLSAAEVGLVFHLEALLVAVMVWRLTSALAELWQVRLDLDRLLEVLASPLSEEAVRGAGRAGEAPRIEVEEVSCPFDDDAGRWLRQIGFAVEAGTSLAVVGLPGSGDGQVLRLLEGSASPRQGRVRFLGRDRRDLVQLATHALTEQPLILEGTVRENLRASVRQADFDAAAYGDALDLAGIRGWIRRLPIGDATPLGACGQRLSLEECQGLDVVRAVLAEPELLLLDRPLSGSGGAHRSRVLERLLARFRGRATVVFVPSAVGDARFADRILVLLDGRQAGFGTHEELLEANPVYRSLASASAEG